MSLGSGIAAGTTLNAAQSTQTNGVVTVNAENLSTVNVTFSRGSSNVITKTLTATGAALGLALNAADVNALAGTVAGSSVISVGAFATDVAGNVSPAGVTSANNALQFSLDVVAPVLNTASVQGSINRVNSNTGNVSYTLNFSEPLNVTDHNLTSSSFSVNNAVVSSVTDSGDHQQFIVVLTPNSGVASGTLQAILLANTAFDAAGNKNSSAYTLTLGGLPIDTLRPSISSFAFSSGTFNSANPGAGRNAMRVGDMC